MNGHRAFGTLLAPLALFLVAAAPAPSENPGGPRCEETENIGTATMTEDGTITLRLRTLPPGPVGEGVFRYRVGDANYDDVKAHIIGGIKPGETRPVRPWC